MNEQLPGAGGIEHSPSPVRWLAGTRPPSTPPLLLPLPLEEPPPLPLEELTPPLLLEELPPPLDDPVLAPLLDPLEEPLVEPPLPEPLLDPVPELPASGTSAAWPPQPQIRGRIAMRLMDLRMGEALRPRACATRTPRPRSPRGPRCAVFVASRVRHLAPRAIGPP
jgi:hypothetical protein